MKNQKKRRFKRLDRQLSAYLDDCASCDGGKGVKGRLPTVAGFFRTYGMGVKAGMEGLGDGERDYLLTVMEDEAWRIGVALGNATVLTTYVKERLLSDTANEPATVRIVVDGGTEDGQ